MNSVPGRSLGIADVARSASAVLAGLLLSAGALAGQTGPPRPQPPPAIGVRGGFDTYADEWSIGGQIRFTVPSFPGPEAVPSGDIFLSDENTGWQFNLDAVIPFLPLIYAGGGLAIARDSLPGSAAPRTETGYNLLVGLQAPVLPIPIMPFAEARWTFLNRVWRPFRLVVGLNVLLGGRQRRSR